MSGAGIDRGPATRVTATQQSQTFSGQQVARRDETAVAGAAEHERALLESRFTIAQRFRRDEADFRIKILAECGRTSFAEAARYKRPAGKKKNDTTGQWEESFAEGFSIRFIETALRLWRNNGSTSRITYEDDDMRKVSVLVQDYESNTFHELDRIINKTVERRQLKKGQQAISTRVNSYGDTLYIVEATEADVAAKSGSEISKALRTCGERLIPADVLDECWDACERVLLLKDAQDPAAARKQIADGFAELGVLPSELARYLGGPLESASPAQLMELRGVYIVVKEGTPWSEIIDAKLGEAAAAADANAPQSEQAKKVLDAINAGRKKAEETVKKRETKKDEKKTDEKPTPPAAEHTPPPKAAGGKRAGLKKAPETTVDPAAPAGESTAAPAKSTAGPAVAPVCDNCGVELEELPPDGDNPGGFICPQCNVEYPPAPQ